MTNLAAEATTGDPAPAKYAVSASSSSTQATDPSSPSSESPTRVSSAETTETQRQSPVDPRVVSLRAMFPDYDDAILQSVLESVNWKQDRAIDTLLIMNDPDYKPETQTQNLQQGPTLSQEELDEQFARQLLLRDQQKITQRAASRLHSTPGGGPPGQPLYYPASPPQRQNSQGASEFQDQFNKFAESGKKTLGNLFQKVKTKIQEFEQGRPSQPPNQYWISGPAPYYGPSHPNLPPQGNEYPNSYPAPGPPTSSGPYPTSTSPPPKSNNPTSTTAITATPTLQNKAPPFAGPSSPRPIDGGKFGLLPKKPISLIRDENTLAGEVTPSVGASEPQKTAVKGYVVDDDDDDGLEYAENPFDDPKHKK